jgi:hypothetical protein
MELSEILKLTPEQLDRLADMIEQALVEATSEPNFIAAPAIDNEASN